MRALQLERKERTVDARQREAAPDEQWVRRSSNATAGKRGGEQRAVAAEASTDHAVVKLFFSPEPNLCIYVVLNT